MIKIIKEIRQQPHHVRELATLLCTIVVVAIVGLVWFHSFQRDIYALLNPEEESQAQDRLFAQESKSLFGSMWETISNGKAQISDIFSKKSNQTDVVNDQPSSNTLQNSSTHPLPVSGNKK